MSDVTNLNKSRSAAELIAAAKKEVQDQFEKAAIAKLKRKYEELQVARMAVSNIEREIKDIEEQINDGTLRP